MTLLILPVGPLVVLGLFKGTATKNQRSSPWLNFPHWSPAMGKVAIQLFMITFDRSGLIHNSFTIEHYNNVIVGVMASQITGLTSGHSTVYSGVDKKKKTSKPRVTDLCVGNSPETGEFPAQMASNSENVSLWWSHHENTKIARHTVQTMVSWPDPEMG